MVAIGRRSGVVTPGAYAAPGFLPATAPALGNQVPANTGAWDNDPRPGVQANFPRGPSPSSPGYVIGGQLGSNDGQMGADPRAAKLQPAPRTVAPVIEGQASNGGPAGCRGCPVRCAPCQPLMYAEGASRSVGPDGWGPNSWAARLGFSQDPLAHGRPSFWRGGIQGFNDKLTVKDRHAYWDAGSQRTGTTFTPATANPNTYNDPMQSPPRPDLRTVNRTVSYQKGTDASRNQDDLSRPYTWVGEQGSGWSPVYGGVPGLYQPYGTRGGVPYPIVDPTGGQGGRETVWAGPPHGLHSETFPDGLDTLRRYQRTPQMRPVRVDRPSNSPQAGQSYSQTVQHQGGPPRGPKVTAGPNTPVHHFGRGWTGPGGWNLGPGQSS